MTADHRQNYTPTRMLLNGRRMVDDYGVDDAVDDYMRLHPEANRDEVRAEVEQAAA